MITSEETAVISARYGGRIIVALDVPDESSAFEIVDELQDQVGAFKIGLQLFTSAGPTLVRKIVEKGHRVFLDLKFHDIPNTVAAASVEAARLGVWMFNVHCSGGSEMMLRTANDVSEHCLTHGMPRPLIIGVTVLTSGNASTLNEIGIAATPQEQVLTLARMAHSSGLDGVVCSPLEASVVRSAIGSDPFITVTPGIRGKTATNDDQKRVTTFGDAMRNGSDYAVIGRPIVSAPDRQEAVRQIIADAANSIE